MGDVSVCRASQTSPQCQYSLEKVHEDHPSVQRVPVVTRYLLVYVSQAGAFCPRFRPPARTCITLMDLLRLCRLVWGRSVALSLGGQHSCLGRGALSPPPQLPLTESHRITECSGLEGTSVGHLVQPLY